MKHIMKTLSLVLLTAALLIPASGCFRKDNNDKTLTDLVAHISKSGLTVESMTPTVPEMITAQDGIFVRISGKDVQLFKYDTRIPKQREKLDKVAGNGKITILGVDFPAKTNGSFIMLGYKDNIDEAKIVAAFESF